LATLAPHHFDPDGILAPGTRRLHVERPRVNAAEAGSDAKRRQTHVEPVGGEAVSRSGRVSAGKPEPEP
jgi:hypothetical protein